ncbi:glycosyltransferase [Aestuariivirga litoralis]|uniref:glycosyltransferase n=1 Tax=Aestuariivirga litoralis TaxID=2650924 RepID=UPI0018C631C8|nr:glycosyltransferase [Aestuariivirga litoralis]
MIDANHSIIVVTPVFEDAEASTRLFQELAQQFGPRVYVVAVDDGSVRQPVQISALQAAGLQGAVVRLRRNVGHQRAIAIGLGHVSEFIQPHQRVVVMDSDGEDLPSSVPALLAELEKPDHDIVVASRRSRVETWRFKLFYILYKQLFSVMTGRNVSFGNFMAMKASAAIRLVAMQELSIHLAGAVLVSKLRTAICALDRGPRYAGRSKMNFVGLVLHGFKGLMVFAEDVLVRVGIACACIGAFAIFGVCLAIVLKLLGFSTPGWFSIALGVLLLIFLQTGALALMTLMLTGVVRGGTVTTQVAYHHFIDEVIETKGA